MVGGAIGALFAVAMLGLALIVLIVTAFFNRRLAGIGFVALVIWLFYPIVAFHVSYKISTMRSVFDHERVVIGGAYGVILPPDGSLTRTPRHWSDDPAGSLYFEAHPEGFDSGTSFRIYRIVTDPQTFEDNLPNRLDWSDCTPTSTQYGLSYFAPDSCPTPENGRSSYERKSHSYVTPADAPYQAVFTVPSFRDPEIMGSIYAQIGPFSISASGRGQPISQWRLPLDHIAHQLDAHFTVLPAPSD